VSYPEQQTGIPCIALQVCHNPLDRYFPIVRQVQQTTDNAQLQPMLERVEKNLGELPAAVSADSGFWSPDQVAAVEALGVDPHVATGREAKLAQAPEPEAEACSGIAPGTPAALRDAMQRKLASGPRTRPVPQAKSDRRAGLRADQGVQGLPPLLAARTGRRAGRMVDRMPHAQPAQALPLRLSAQTGLNEGQTPSQGI
jgi:hypothetical protein